MDSLFRLRLNALETVGLQLISFIGYIWYKQLMIALQTSPFYTLLGTKWALIWAPHWFRRKDPFVFVHGIHVGPKWAVFVGSPDLDCIYSM